MLLIIVRELFCLNLPFQHFRFVRDVNNNTAGIVVLLSILIEIRRFLIYSVGVIDRGGFSLDL